jgi:hypothetical protein
VRLLEPATESFGHPYFISQGRGLCHLMYRAVR